MIIFFFTSKKKKPHFLSISEKVHKRLFGISRIKNCSIGTIGQQALCRAEEKGLEKLTEVLLSAYLDEIGSDITSEMIDEAIKKTPVLILNPFGERKPPKKEYIH